MTMSLDRSWLNSGLADLLFGGQRSFGDPMPNTGIAMPTMQRRPDIGSMLDSLLSVYQTPMSLPDPAAEQASYEMAIKGDRKNALSDALGAAGAALIAAGGTGKFGTGLSQAMALGMDAYQKRLAMEQKLRDDQEARVRQRRQDAQQDWIMKTKIAEAPMEAMAKAQSYETGQVRLDDMKKQQEDAKRFEAALGGISQDDPVWKNESVSQLGLWEKFQAFRDAGASAEAMDVLSKALSAAGHDSQAAKAQKYAIELEKIRNAGQIEVWKIRADGNSGTNATVASMIKSRLAAFDKAYREIRSKNDRKEEDEGRLSDDKVMQQALQQSGITAQELAELRSAASSIALGGGAGAGVAAPEENQLKMFLEDLDPADIPWAKARAAQLGKTYSSEQLLVDTLRKELDAKKKTGAPR